jgi:tape measure domain-containing protein
MGIVASQLVGKITIQGAPQGEKDLRSVGTAATSLGRTLSSMKPFDVGRIITNEEAAQAKLKLLEAGVTKARAKLQTLEKAADAGEAVTGIDEAQARLTLLEKRAQDAREKLTTLGSAATILGNKLSSVKPFNAGKAVSDVDVARSKLTLIESDVTKAREKLQTLEHAADAGKSVTGIDEARAKLTLLERKAQEAREDLEKLGHESNKTSALLGKIGSAGISALSKVGSVGKSALSALVPHFGALISSAVNFTTKIGFVAQGLQALWSTVKGVTSALFSQNASLEQVTVSFGAFIPNAQLLKKTMADLRQVAAVTPFGTDEVNKASLSFLNMNIAAQDLTGWINNVGAAVSKVGGNGQTLEEVAMILQQMSNKGHIYTEELLQLSERNIPAFQLLADAMGVPIEQLQKMITNGEVGKDKIQLLVQAMGKFGGDAMVRQGRTFNGLLSTLKDNATLAWMSFTGPLFDQVKGGLERLGELVSSPKFQQFATTMGQNVGGALLQVGKFVQTNVMPVFRDFWQIINDEPMGMLIVNLKNLGGAVLRVIEALSPLKNIFKDTTAEAHGISLPVSLFAGTLYHLSEIIDKDVVPLLNDLTAFLNVVMPPAANIAREAMDGVRSILDKIKGPVGDLLAALAPLVAQIIIWIDQSNIVHDALSLVGDILATIIEDAAKLVVGLTDLVKWFKDASPPAQILEAALIGVAAGLVAVKVAMLAVKAAKFAESIPGIISLLGEWAGALIPVVVETLIAAGPYILIGAIVALVVAGIVLAIMHWGEISTWLVDRWHDVQVFFVWLWGRISEIFGSIGKWFGDRFSEARNGILSALGNIGQWFGDRWKDISAPFIAVGKWFGDRFSEARSGTTGAFSSIGRWFEDRFTEARDGIVRVFSVIGRWFGDRWHDIQAIFMGTGKWFEDRFTEARDGIARVFSAIGRWLGDRWHDIQGIFAGVGRWFGDRFAEIYGPVKPVVDYLHEVFRTLWRIIVALFGIAGRWFGDRFNEVNLAIRFFLGLAWQWVKDQWKETIAPFVSIGRWFGDRFNEANLAIRFFLGLAWQWVKDQWKETIATFVGIGKWFGDRFNEASLAIRFALAFAWQWVKDQWHDLQKSLASIGEWFGMVFTGAKIAIMVALSPLIGWLRDQWHGMQAIFAGVGVWFRDRFQEAWNFVTSLFGHIGQWFQDRWVDIKNIFAGIGKWFHDRFQEAWNSISGIFGTVGKWFNDRFTDIRNYITDRLNDSLSAIEGFINFFGEGLNHIAEALGTTGSIPHATLPRIPKLARGTDSHVGGLALTGEEGRELAFVGNKKKPVIVGAQGPQLVDLPRGATVVPHKMTEYILSLAGGTRGIPSYAEGTGNVVSDVWGWLSDKATGIWSMVSKGAQSVLDWIINTAHIVAPSLGPMTNIASGIFNKVKDYALGWLSNLLPKFGGGEEGGGTSVGDFGSFPGTLQDWITQAIALTRVPTSWAASLATIAMNESGGNPSAINDWDSNAAAGDPSRGLFQTIGATFAAYALPGHKNIYNPVDNTSAAIEYILSRYGTVFNVPGIVSLANGGAYVGYANGGIINEPISGIGLLSGTRYAFGERGPEQVTPLPYLPNGTSLGLSPSAGSSRTQSAPQVIQVDVYLDGDRVTARLMPSIVNQIRYRTGVNSF